MYFYRDSDKKMVQNKFDCFSYYIKANWIQKVLFTWIYPILKRQKLSSDVIGDLPKDLTTEYHYNVLTKSWK